MSRVSYHTLGLYILGDTLLGLGHAYAGVSSEPFLHATRPFVTVFFIYSVSVHFFASRYAVVVYRVASASAAVLASRYSLSLSLFLLLLLLLLLLLPVCPQLTPG